MQEGPMEEQHEGPGGGEAPRPWREHARAHTESAESCRMGQRKSCRYGLQKTRTAGVERYPEVPATEAFRSKGRRG